jgi:flagellar basal-body rod modification protein FlgD
MSISGLKGSLTDDNIKALDKIANDIQNQAKLKNQELGKDAFLKLMMTQLAHQDPLQPLDNKEMITQMAQFTSVEQMGAMATAAVKQVNQNEDILAALKKMGDNTSSTDLEKKMETLIEKTDRTIEQNTLMLEELKKLNASKAQAAYD